jgi:hypothetical protein
MDYFMRGGGPRWWITIWTRQLRIRMALRRQSVREKHGMRRRVRHFENTKDRHTKAVCLRMRPGNSAADSLISRSRYPITGPRSSRVLPSPPLDLLCGNHSQPEPIALNTSFDTAWFRSQRTGERLDPGQPAQPWRFDA